MTKNTALQIRSVNKMVKELASTSSNFNDFVYDVTHDRTINSMVSPKIVRILIQQNCSTLA